MANLIFSRRPDSAPLLRDEIRRMAPSVFTQDHKMSPRYGQVTTALAIDVLADYNFHPVQAAQKGQGAHKAHLLAFSGSNGDGEGRQEIVLYNSHDGTSSLKMFAGYFRFICSNGMVAGEGFEAKLRHVQSTTMAFEDMIREVARKLPDMMGHIDRMRSKSIRPEYAVELAMEAAQLRWNKQLINDTTVGDLLEARRDEDRDLNLWTVFNKVQEGLVRGGPRLATGRKSRALGSIPKVLEVNRGLWDLVDA